MDTFYVSDSKGRIATFTDNGLTGTLGTPLTTAVGNARGMAVTPDGTKLYVARGTSVSVCVCMFFDSIDYFYLTCAFDLGSCVRH